MPSTHFRLQDMLMEAAAAFARAEVRHALAGGLAMAMHGRVRATEDINFLVDADHESQANAALEALGYRGASNGIATRYVRAPLATLPDVREWIDLLLACRESGRELLSRAAANPVIWQGVSLPVVDPAGMVLMKCLALAVDPARSQDAENVQFLLANKADHIDLPLLERTAATLGSDVLAALQAVRRPRIAEPLSSAESRL